MAHNPGDDKNEPSLELPSLKLPGFGRRRKKTDTHRASEQPVERPVERSVEDPTPADLLLGEPEPDWNEPTQPVPVPQPADDHEVTQQLTPPPGRRTGMPTVPAKLAAVLTGLLVGAAGGAATWGAMNACESVRGVSSCGGAPGFFILVAIVVLMVLLGSLLLKAFKVPEAGSTSFLAVGVVAVIVMLLLLEVIFSMWMFAVIPALTAVAYLLAHWVTTRFDDATGRRDWT